MAFQITITGLNLENGRKALEKLFEDFKSHYLEIGGYWQDNGYPALI